MALGSKKHTVNPGFLIYERIKSLFEGTICKCVSMIRSSFQLIQGSGGEIEVEGKQLGNRVGTQGAQGRKRLGYQFEDREGQSIIMMIVLENRLKKQEAQSLELTRTGMRHMKGFSLNNLLLEGGY